MHTADAGLYKGRYRARIALSQAQVLRAQKFRSRFFGRSGDVDIDPFDTAYTHVLIEDDATGNLMGCFRMSLFSGKDIDLSYAAQYYDLAALTYFDGEMLEIGRLCSDPDRNDPDILRLAWAFIARQVDLHDVRLLFGCASFEGVDPERYSNGFAFLKARHLANSNLAPHPKAPEIYHFAQNLPEPPAREKAMLELPPLLRSYLAMRAWVSDHAVIDRDLNTLLVFTGVEIDKVPAARKRLLRAL